MSDAKQLEESLSVRPSLCNFLLNRHPRPKQRSRLIYQDGGKSHSGAVQQQFRRRKLVSRFAALAMIVQHGSGALKPWFCRAKQIIDAGQSANMIRLELSVMTHRGCPNVPARHNTVSRVEGKMWVVIYFPPEFIRP